MNEQIPVLFDEVISLKKINEKSYRAECPASWRGGRGQAQGGVLAAQLLEAMTLTVSDFEKPPHSITVQLLRAPTIESYEIEVTQVRSGRTTSNLRAEMIQDGKISAIALGLFAKHRDGPEFNEIPIPDSSGPDLDRKPDSYTPEFSLPFANQVVVQQRLGTRPFTTNEGPMDIAGWIGFTEKRPIDAAGLMVLCDAQLCPWWTRFEEMIPSATVDYTVHFRGDLPCSTEHEFVFIQCESKLAKGGFVDWDAIVWDPNGTLLCQARQQVIAPL